MKIFIFLSSVMFLANLFAGVAEINNKSSIQMFVVYDNNPYNERLKTDWGFSCFVEGLEKSILFDTGANGQILLSNMEKLGIQPEKVGLCHCSGDEARILFYEEYQDDFMEIGVGKEIKIQ